VYAEKITEAVEKRQLAWQDSLARFRKRKPFCPVELRKGRISTAAWRPFKNEWITAQRRDVEILVDGEGRKALA
jgi:hypothetical protein